MLKKIHIENFILIDHLDLDVSDGLTMITGETGAGKSIILGALGLVQGKRADLSSIRDTSTKCIVEAVFDISSLKLKSFFDDSDLDYEPETIVRREILPSGKSRAFINDTPVNLQVMSQLGERLIDIHSQHQTLEIGKDRFQRDFLNSYLIHITRDKKQTYEQVLAEYQKKYQEYNRLSKELKQWQDQKSQLLKESDYNQYLLNELEEARLDHVNLFDLEQEHEQLSNVEEIKNTLSLSGDIISNDDLGIIKNLRNLKQQLESITRYNEKYEQQLNRVTSLIIELEDVHYELSKNNDDLQLDPARLDVVQEVLQQIHQLFRKHNVDTVEELVDYRNQLADLVFESSDITRKIDQAQYQIDQLEKEMNASSDVLFKLRTQYAPEISSSITKMIQQLGMPNASFEVQIDKTDQRSINGMDQLQFMLAANKGSQLQPVQKAASGGELSRVMLAVKSLYSNYTKLATIIFDEIDTGVSGAIAEQMAHIMKNMSQEMQVITITHLPQIAAAGKKHLKVTKTTTDQNTTSNLIPLNTQERVEEIAQMLSGGNISDAARENARVLIG